MICLLSVNKLGYVADQNRRFNFFGGGIGAEGRVFFNHRENLIFRY